MTRAQVHIGRIYAVKVSGKIQPVKIIRELSIGGWEATNTNTGREIRIRSAVKLRYEMGADGKRAGARCGVCVSCRNLVGFKAIYSSRLTAAVNSSASAPNESEAKQANDLIANIRTEWARLVNDHPCTGGSK